jgi:hypothetical protein
MVDEIKRLSDNEILKGDIESMAADFAAKHQIKLPVLEKEFKMFQSTFPVQRLRRRYRDVLRAQVAATLLNPDKAAVEEELRALFAALEG